MKFHPLDDRAPQYAATVAGWLGLVDPARDHLPGVVWAAADPLATPETTCEGWVSGDVVHHLVPAGMSGPQRVTGCRIEAGLEPLICDPDLTPEPRCAAFECFGEA